MTGPEHYRQAEQMVELYQSEMEAAAAARDLAQIEAITSLMPTAIAVAQVHATLALAAATAHHTAARFIGDDHVNDWASAWRPRPGRCDETDKLGQRCHRPEDHAGAHSIPVAAP